MKALFIESLYNKQKVKLTFFSKEDGHTLSRLCAPMDYGPFKRAVNQNDRYHFWDYESDKKNHPLILLPNQIIKIEAVNETFDPAEFVTWKFEWHVKRDWGKYS